MNLLILWTMTEVKRINIMRLLVKELCDTIISKQAKYKMQVDAHFLLGVLKWENGKTNSNDYFNYDFAKLKDGDFLIYFLYL